MPDTPTPGTARQTITGLLAGIDLTALPDPELEWFSSSASERHPGKRYHYSRHCEDLWKIKDANRRTYRHRYSTVAGRICYRCAPQGGDEQFATGKAAQAVRDLHARLLLAADGVDADPAGKTAAALVADTGRQVRAFARSRADDGYVSVFTAALNALADTRRNATVDEDAQAVLTREAVVNLLSRPSTSFAYSGGERLADLVQVPPESRLDLRLLDSSGTGQVERIQLAKPWQAFREAVCGGQSFQQAHAVARPKLLAQPDPLRLSQLPERIPVPAGATDIGPAEMVAAWRPLAEQVAAAVADAWLAQCTALADELAALGTVDVVVPPAETGAQTLLQTETRRAAEVFPSRVDVDGTRTLTVPVAVAGWLERCARMPERSAVGRVGQPPAKRTGRSVTLAEGRDERTEVARRLLADTTANPLSLLDALRSAHGITAAPPADPAG